jgi:Zn-dependent protease/CBS domain-containing protein
VSLLPKRPTEPTPGLFGGRVIRLGRLLGIRIGIDPSWFLVFFLVSYSLGIGFAEKHGAWSPFAVWGSAVSASLIFFLSILLHELGHSLVALALDLPVRSITLFLFGGAAELSAEPRRPRDEFLIAVAGPAVSGLLGLAFLLGWYLAPSEGPLEVVTLWLGLVNLGVAGFNMFPGFPLDGGRVLRAVLWKLTGSFERATLWSGQVGMLFGRILIAMGIVLAVLSGQLFEGLFVAFMGWFLLRAARANIVQSMVSSRLRGVRVENALETNLPEVDGWDTLEDLASGPFSDPQRRLVLVAEEGRPVGVLGTLELREIAENKRAYHLARQVMTPLARLVRIDPALSLLEALRTFDREGVTQLLVERDHEILGVLTRDQLTRALRTP